VETDFCGVTQYHVYIEDEDLTFGCRVSAVGLYIPDPVVAEIVFKV